MIHFLGIQDTLKALADPIRRENTKSSEKRSIVGRRDLRTFSGDGGFHIEHLSVLKEADLIRDKREGKFIYYELNASVLEEIMLWITDLKGASDNEGNDTEK